MKGGWVGGDAWFGSVMSCVELAKEFGVYSTFILKGHTYMFPYTALHSVLVARHGDRPAGHWVTMATTIAGVQVIAIAYAWSQRAFPILFQHVEVLSLVHKGISPSSKMNGETHKSR